MKRYVCTEHLETSLGDYDPSYGLAKYEVVGECFESENTQDIAVLDVDNVRIFSPDGKEMLLDKSVLSEIEKWLEKEALTYLNESRLVSWQEIAGERRGL